MKKYSEDMIKEAIDIAIGDGGYRRNEVPYDVISDEVIEILKDLENPDASKRTTATEKFLSLPPFDNKTKGE